MLAMNLTSSQIFAKRDSHIG